MTQKNDKVLSSFAFNFNFRHYIMGTDFSLDGRLSTAPQHTGSCRPGRTFEYFKTAASSRGGAVQADIITVSKALLKARLVSALETKM